MPRQWNNKGKNDKIKIMPRREAFEAFELTARHSVRHSRKIPPKNKADIF